MRGGSGRGPARRGAAGRRVAAGRSGRRRAGRAAGEGPLGGGPAVVRVRRDRGHAAAPRRRPLRLGHCALRRAHRPARVVARRRALARRPAPPDRRDRPVRDGDTTVEWSYERGEASYSRDPDIRLPRPGDLLPPGARRAVAARRRSRGRPRRCRRDASPGRAPPACGVRPPSPLSSIDRVDLWVGPDSGLPLLVEVYADGDTRPSFTSALRRRLHRRRPGDDVLAFEPTAEHRRRARRRPRHRRRRQPVRPAAPAGRRSPGCELQPGLGRRGRGLRRGHRPRLIAIPLRDREAERAARADGAHARASSRTPSGTVVSLGPLGVLLTGAEGDGGWLLAGHPHPRRARAGRSRRRRPASCSSRTAMSARERDPHPRPDQALRPASPPSTALDLDVREGDVYGFLGANGSGKTTHRADAARPGAGHLRQRRGARRADARAPAARCCPRSARWSRVRRRTPTSPGAPTSRSSTPLGAAAPRRTAGRGSTRCSTGSGWRGSTSGPVRGYSLGMRQRLGLAARAAAPTRGCWCSTSRPTAWTRRASARSATCCSSSTREGTTIFLSSHLLAEIEQLCDPGRGARPRPAGRSRRSWTPCAAPTGRTVVRTPDADRRAGAARRPGSRSRDGERLLVRGDDPAGAQRAAGRRRASGSASWRPSGARLEEVVLAATAAGTDRFGRAGRPMIRVELHQAAAQPAHLGHDRAASTPCPPWWRCCWRSPTSGRGPGTGPAFLSAVLTDGTLFPLAALAIVLPLFLPIAVALIAGRGDRRARRSRARCATCWSGRSGRTRLLVAKLVAVMAFVVLTVAGRRGRRRTSSASPCSATAP